MQTEASALAGVIAAIGETLGIEERAATFDASTPLLDSIAELDSMAIVALVVSIEERFDVEVDEDDLTGDVFETVGTLTEFVSAQLDRA